ncbi:MAG: hypothetical protein E6I52_25145 [Chloroflexi bacterium]|nr:MAG: hypothetical protein E6I52_25145 [Chloroflexota bacterium]
MAATDAQVTPTAGGPVGVQAAERVGVRVPAAVRAERRAWLILWVAFATFCALVFATIKFSIEFISTAQVDQSAEVTASRGQVVLSLPGSAEKTLLGNRTGVGVGTELSLDRTTSADLQFFDDSKIKMLGGSSVELTRMEVGRFIKQHSLLLTQTGGPIRYTTSGSPMDVLVPKGLVQLAAHGDYTIWLDGDVTRVLVYGGEARVSAGGVTVPVTDAPRTEIDGEGPAQTPADRQFPILLNSDFSKRYDNWQAWDEGVGQPNSPLDVNGQRFLVAGPDDGSIALRVYRESVKAEHGETGLVQKLNQQVSGFRHLWLKAMVRLDYADLSGGGTLGSEYPMMLQVKYEAPGENTLIPWVVGLYYSNQDNRKVPEGVGMQWPQGEWKAYSVDLMDTEPSNVPYRLIEFAVMGQGHSYDARIANISLVGD